jgi:hypothetical protein
MTIAIKGIEFDTAGEAVQYAEAGGGRAVLLDGKRLVVATAEAHRMEKAGVEFAYLIDHDPPDGKRRIMTIPVND